MRKHFKAEFDPDFGDVYKSDPQETLVSKRKIKGMESIQIAKLPKMLQLSGRAQSPGVPNNG